MKAIAVTHHSAESYQVEIEKPLLTPDDVLVQVKYSSLDTATKDVVDKTATGYLIHARTDPLVVGWHFAGIVMTVGTRVNDLATGDTVFGFLDHTPTQKQGAFSEYVSVRADHCARVPANVDPAMAAAASIESITALQALRNHGKLAQGQSVLILGAGGGVGSAAMQMVKTLGASHVTAVCSTKDVERVRKWGADVVVDRSRVDDIFDGKKYDLILDTPSTRGPAFKSSSPKDLT